MADARSLRILAITSRPLIDSNGEPIPLLDVAEERRRLRAALKQAKVAAHVHFLPEATTGEVMKALQDEWDIVHFTGHGNAQGLLVLEDEFGVGHLLRQPQMASLFGNCKAPLVVLSACHSETAGKALTAAGIANVIAVDARVPIADHAAIIFAEHLYGALAHGRTVADSFDDAQKAVSLDSRVGDHHPPRDNKGKEEEPWSKRFRLIGGGAHSFASLGTGGYEETGTADAAGKLRRQTDFVGRAKEIVEIARAFQKQPRAALVGPGGLGKTALSQAAAGWLADCGRVQAVVWASAGNDEGEYKLRDLQSLLDIIGRALRLPFNEQTSTEERKRIVRDTFAQIAALLILDNWETLESSVKKELWEFILSLPEATRVLVTSREELPARHARNIHLDPLRDSDAIRLFANVARNAGYFERNPELSDEETALLLQICAYLSGYPLAVEVVAGQTASRTFAEIWSDLRETPHLVLETKDEITGEPRGVWTSLHLSYNILSENEKLLFRRLCVFLAPARADDIAAITEVETSRVALDGLVRRSLVRFNEGAYSLLPVIRQYAESKLADTMENIQELHATAAIYYRDRGTLEGTVLASDHLYELAARYGSREAAREFIKYLRSLYERLVIGGHWAEARRKLAEWLGSARVLGDRLAEGHALVELGKMSHRMGDYPAAADWSEKRMKIVEELGDNSSIAVTQHQLGMLAQKQGNYASASAWYEKSKETFEECGYKKGIVLALHQLGKLTQKQGDYASSSAWYEKILKTYEEFGDKSGVAQAQHQLGMLAQAQGDYTTALDWYEKSMEVNEELGDKRGIAKTQDLLGVLAQAQGDYTTALAWYEKSMKIAEELGAKSSIAITQNQLGNLALARQDYHTALRYYVQAHAIFQTLNSPYQKTTLKNIGIVRQAVGEEEFRAWMAEFGMDLEEIE